MLIVTPRNTEINGTCGSRLQRVQEVSYLIPGCGLLCASSSYHMVITTIGSGPPVMVEVCAERLFYKHGFALGGKPFINLVVHLLQSGDADFSDKTLYLHDGFPFTYLRLFRLVMITRLLKPGGYDLSIETPRTAGAVLLSGQKPPSSRSL